MGMDEYFGNVVNKTAPLPAPPPGHGPRVAAPDPSPRMPQAWWPCRRRRACHGFRSVLTACPGAPGGDKLGFEIL
jgi:hypothetical protein